MLWGETWPRGADFCGETAADTKQAWFVFIKGFVGRNPSRIGF